MRLPGLPRLLTRVAALLRPANSNRRIVAPQPALPIDDITRSGIRWMNRRRAYRPLRPSAVRKHLKLVK